MLLSLKEDLDSNFSKEKVTLLQTIAPRVLVDKRIELDKMDSEKGDDSPVSVEHQDDKSGSIIDKILVWIFDSSHIKTIGIVGLIALVLGLFPIPLLSILLRTVGLIGIILWIVSKFRKS